MGDLLKAQLEDLGITVGNALLPALSDLVKDLRPVIAGFADWAKANPEVVKTVAKVVVGLIGGGGLLIGITQVASAVSTLVGGLGRLLFAFLPLLGPIAVIGGLFLMYQNNVLGFKDRIDELGVSLRRLLEPVQLLKSFMENGVNAKFDATTGDLTMSSGPIYSPQRQQLINTQYTKSVGASVPGMTYRPGRGTSEEMAFQRNYYAGAIPTRDSGGDVNAGQSVFVGRGAQPELFVPHSAGTMFPAGSYGGGPKMLTVILRADSFEEKIILDIAKALSPGGAY